MNIPRFTWAPARRLAAATPLAALVLAACDLNTTDPAVVNPEALNTVEALPSLRAGAIIDFKTAFSGSGGNTEGVILGGGLRTDEWRNSDTFETRQDIDRGVTTITNATNQVLFRNLQQARLSAEFAASRYASLDPKRAQHGEVLSLAGFTYVLFAENYCSGVPFSEVDLETRDITFGAPETTAQMLNRALMRFDAAIANAGGNLARVGRARALVNLGRFADAAALVGPVPTAFVYNIEHSENTQAENNGVFFLNNINRRWSVPDTTAGGRGEGVNGLPFRSANDPRVPVAAQLRGGRVRVGLDNRTPMYVQFKYPSRSADIPLATGIEARLIEAEAALQAGDVATLLARLNALRANRALYPCPTDRGATPNYSCSNAVALAPFTAADVATRRAQEDVLFRERAFWLFATAHRLGDMRRLVRQYGRPFETVYPQGSYPKGGPPYGPEASLRVPVDERNNALYSTDACDPTKA